MTPKRREDFPAQPDDDFFDAVDDGATVDRSTVAVPPPEVDAVAEAMDAWTKPKPKRKKPPARVEDGKALEAMGVAKECAASGDWSEATPRVFVALYALLFERVYGLPTADLTPKSRVLAEAAAKRLLRVEFDEDPVRMAEYMKWSWGREKEREEWRRANQRDGRPLGWALMFGGALLNDYRLALSRRMSTRPSSSSTGADSGTHTDA